jgi:hypothetical protein
MEKFFVYAKNFCVIKTKTSTNPARFHLAFAPKLIRNALAEIRPI